MAAAAGAAAQGHSVSKGSLLLLSSSVGFGVMFYLTPLLHPMPAEAILTLRIITCILALYVLFAVTKQTKLVSETWRFIREKPLRIITVIFSGVLLSLQLWMFAWGPLHGRGLPVALGYFLMPLVLVIIGRFLYKDRMQWWHWIAVLFAAIGVGFEVVRVGSFSWETLVVALGYPLYFVVRRANGTAHLGGMMWEQLAMLPAALLLIPYFAFADPVMVARPELWIYGLLVSVFGSSVLVIWILSSKLLPMSIFGLLSYFEPVFLAAAAFFSGELLTTAEIPVYAAVTLAILVILTGGTLTALRQRRAAKQLVGGSAQAPRSKGPAGDSDFDSVVPVTGSIPIIQER